MWLNALAALIVSVGFAASPDGPSITYPKKGSAVAVELSNGSVIKGIYDGRHDGAVWIKQDKGEVGIEPATISSVRVEENPTSEFSKRFAALDDGDAPGAWVLALWASARGLEDSANELAERVIKLEPGHTEARAFLGHVKVGSDWMTEDDAMRARGFVAHKGRWVHQTEYEQVLRDEAQREHDERLARYERRSWYLYSSTQDYTPNRYSRSMMLRQAMLNNPTALWEPYRFYPVVSGVTRRRR